MVVANHPHVIQAAMPDGDALVAFALGTFISDQDCLLETKQRASLETRFLKRSTALRLLPLQSQNQLQPILVPAAEAELGLRRIVAATACRRRTAVATGPEPAGGASRSPDTPAASGSPQTHR